MKVLEIVKYRELGEGVIELLEACGETFHDDYDDSGFIFICFEDLVEYLEEEFPEDKFDFIKVD